MATDSNCLPFSLSRLDAPYSIQNDYFTTRYCISTTYLYAEFIFVIVVNTLFVTSHIALMIRKYLKDPRFIKQHGFYLVCLELAYLTFNAIEYALLFSDEFNYLSLVSASIGWSCGTWWISMFVIIPLYIMLLDSINVGAGARLGTESVTRRIWKQLAIRQSFDTLLIIVFFNAAAYYKKIGDLKMNVILICIPIISNALLVMLYNAYVLRKDGTTLITLLSATVEKSKASAMTGSKNSTKDDLKLEDALNRFKMIIPLLTVIFSVFGFGSLVAILIYAFVTIDLGFGMAWITLLQALLHSIISCASFLIANRMFINWNS